MDHDLFTFIAFFAYIYVPQGLRVINYTLSLSFFFITVHCSDSDCEILSSNDEEEEDEEIEEEDVLGGRRIVELSVLAAKLEAGCKNCSAELKLSSCIGEIRYGLGKNIIHLL